MEKITFKGLDYYPIVSETGRVWLDRNLGATRVAESYNDQAAYGEYFAFDEIECPEGWRLPTKEEWEAEIKTWVSRNNAGAFGSALKLPTAGFRIYTNDELLTRGNYGLYWSSSENGTEDAWYLDLYSGNAGATINYQSYGFSVRLIKNI